MNFGSESPSISYKKSGIRMECWIDPDKDDSRVSVRKIGINLKDQYLALLQRRNLINLKQNLRILSDPSHICLIRICNEIKESQPKGKRLLFHYNGHGVPPPNKKGEIWLFDDKYTHYVAISMGMLNAELGSPTIYIFDCANVSCLLDSFKKGGHLKNKKETPKKCDIVILGPSSMGEPFPQLDGFPLDFFTSVLTTPLRIALMWWSGNNHLVSRELEGDLLKKIPGDLNDSRTPLGILKLILTTILDLLAWRSLDGTKFSRLFRQDKLLAQLLRNFFLADRILRKRGFTPVSYPEIPASHKDPLWNIWDHTLDVFFGGFIKGKMVCDFFNTQLTHFELSLRFGDPSPDLPLLYHTINIFGDFRHRALKLLLTYVARGREAVHNVLCCGFFPHLLSLIKLSRRRSRSSFLTETVIIGILEHIFLFDKDIVKDFSENQVDEWFWDMIEKPDLPDLCKRSVCYLLLGVLRFSLRNTMYKRENELRRGTAKLGDGKRTRNAVFADVDRREKKQYLSIIVKELKKYKIEPPPLPRPQARRQRQRLSRRRRKKSGELLTTEASSSEARKSMKRSNSDDRVTMSSSKNSPGSPTPGSPSPKSSPYPNPKDQRNMKPPVMGTVTHQYRAWLLVLLRELLYNDEMLKKRAQKMNLISLQVKYALDDFPQVRACAVYSITTCLIKKSKVEDVVILSDYLPRFSVDGSILVKGETVKLLGELTNSVLGDQLELVQGKNDNRPIKLGVSGRLTHERMFQKKGHHASDKVFAIINEEKKKKSRTFFRKSLSLVRSTSTSHTIGIRRSSPNSPPDEAQGGKAGFLYKPSLSSSLRGTEGLRRVNSREKSGGFPASAPLRFFKTVTDCVNVLCGDLSEKVCVPAQRLMRRIHGESVSRRKVLEFHKVMTDEHRSRLLDNLLTTRLRRTQRRRRQERLSGNMFMKSSRQRSLSQKSIETLESMKSKHVPQEQVTFESNYKFLKMQFHPTLSTLGILHRFWGLSFWDIGVNAKKPLATKTGNLGAKNATDFVFTEDGKHIIVGYRDGNVGVYEDYLGNGPPISGFRAFSHGASVGGFLKVAHQPLHQFYAVGAGREPVKLFDMAKEKEVAGISISVAIQGDLTDLDVDHSPSSMGNIFASGYEDGQVVIFDKRMNGQICRVTEHKNKIIRVQFPNFMQRYTNQVITGCYDGMVKYWDPRNNRKSVKTIQVVSKEEMNDFSVHNMLPIVLVGSMKQFFRLYGLAGEKDIATVGHHQSGILSKRIGQISCVAFHRKEYIFAIGSGNSTKTVTLYK